MTYNFTEKPILETDIKNIEWDDTEAFWIDTEVFHVTLLDGKKVTVDTREVSDQQVKVLVDWLFNNFEPVPSHLEVYAAYQPNVWDLENNKGQYEDMSDEEKEEEINLQEILAYAQMRSEVAKDIYEEYLWL